MNVTASFLFSFSAVMLALWLTKRLWWSFTCCGAFVVSFLVANYSMICLWALGGELTTVDIYPTRDESLAAFQIASAGIFAVLLGMAIGSCLLRKHKSGLFSVQPVEQRRDLNHGMRLYLLHALTFIYILLFVLTFDISNVSAALGSSALERWEYRLTNSGNASYLSVQVAYNFLPYVGACYFALWANTGKIWYLAPVAVAAFATLVLFQKQPLILFLMQLAAIYIYTRSISGKKIRIPWGRMSICGFLLFAVLTGMFMATHESDLPFTERASNSAFAVLERIVGRTASGYVVTCRYVPDVIQYYGFNNVSTIAHMTGSEWVNFNGNSFYFEWGRNGNYSTDTLINFYGGFGMSGLIFFGALLGVALLAMDCWLDGRPSDTNWVVARLFFMKCCIYLNETHVFGVIMGFGGVWFLIHALLLAKPASYEINGDSLFRHRVTSVCMPSESS